MRLQRTIKQAVTLQGKGIHTGEDVGLTIKNAPIDAGISFIRTDLKKRPTIQARVANLSSYSNNLRCTSLEKDSVSVHTIEHLMAALSSLEIDNARIEIDNAELPALDGSALDYARELQKAGRLEQEKEKQELILKKAIWCAEGDSLLIAVPQGSFKISYLLRYDNSGLAAQYVDFAFDSSREKEEIFVKEIAPARTYCLEEEVAGILNKGLGKGADYENTLVIKDGRPIENEFRLRDEPARHKIIDLVGDLFLLNTEIKAHIIGIRSGHSLNAQLLRKLEALL